jgi:hypothetical protein
VRILDQQIAQIRRDKESAIDAQDLEHAAALRDREKQMLGEKASVSRSGQPRTGTCHPWPTRSSTFTVFSASTASSRTTARHSEPFRGRKSGADHGLHRPDEAPTSAQTPSSGPQSHLLRLSKPATRHRRLQRLSRPR